MTAIGQKWDDTTEAKMSHMKSLKDEDRRENENAAALVNPNLCGMTPKTRANKLKECRIDNLPHQAMTRLNNNLSGSLTPPTRNWFDMDFESKDMKDAKVAVEQDLDGYHELLRTSFYDGDLERNQYAAFDEMLTLGTSCIYTGYNKYKALPYYKHKLTNNLWWTVNDFGEADCVLCEYEEPYEKVKQEYPGIDQLDDIKNDKELKKNTFKPLDIQYLIQPVVAGTDASGYNVELAYNKHVFYSGQLDHNPYIIFSYAKSPVGMYGRSPVKMTANQIRNLYELTYTVLKSAKERIAPSIVTTLPVNDKDKIKFGSGRFVYLGGGQAYPMPNGGPMTEWSTIQMLKHEISAAFYDFDIPLEELKNVTATAVNAQKQKLFDGIAASVTHLERVYVKRLIENTIRILIANGRMINPLSGEQEVNVGQGNKLYFIDQGINIRVTSSIKDQYERTEAYNELEAVNAMQPIMEDPRYPLAAVTLKKDKIVEYNALKLGIDADNINNDEEKGQKLQELQQMQQAQEAPAEA